MWNSFIEGEWYHRKDIQNQQSVRSGGSDLISKSSFGVLISLAVFWALTIYREFKTLLLTLFNISCILLLLSLFIIFFLILNLLYPYFYSDLSISSIQFYCLLHPQHFFNFILWNFILILAIQYSFWFFILIY